MSDLILFLQRAKYMRPEQMISRMRKAKIMSRVIKEQRYGGVCAEMLPLAVGALDGRREYLSRFMPDEMMEDRISMLNETYNVDFNEWAADGATKIWNYNLHYFEYCIALAMKYRQTENIKYYEKFRSLVRSWIEKCPPVNKIAWHPYSISRRIPNWLICAELFDKAFAEDEQFADEMYQSIFMQYRTLGKRLEKWQLGNHYLDNLKTMTLCSILFEEDKAYERWLGRFLKELDREVPKDGVHFERSMMIHKLVLEGLLRLQRVIEQKKPQDSEKLRPAISRMLNAAASLEKGMGHTPLFNDSADNVAKSIDSLVSAAGEIGITPEYSENFTDSGYYKMYEGTTALMLDAGEIGPRYVSGHGHCDCLSFELSVGGKPLFVNCGTYQYTSETRKFFRSTAAHNTAVPKDCEQSELWGDYGVSRRVSGASCVRTGDTFNAGCVLYDGTDHERIITLRKGSFSVMDNITNTQVGQIHSYLHIAPYCSVIKRGGEFIIYRGGIDICKLIPKDCDCIVHTSGELASYAPEMGKLTHTSCLEFAWEKDGRPHGYTCVLRTDAAAVAEV